MSTSKKNITEPFREGVIQGVQVRYLKKFQDNRGWLTEIFRSDELSPKVLPVMSYISELSLVQREDLTSMNIKPITSVFLALQPSNL